MTSFHALPEAGGLRDQPEKLMRTARACLNVYIAVRAWNEQGRKPGQMGKWRSEHPDEWATVNRIRDLRSQHAES